MEGQATTREGRPAREFPLPEGRFVAPQPLAGRYEIGRLLASSETSVVLEARDLRTRGGVLIKALRPDALPPPPPGIDDPRAYRVEELRRLRHGLQTERRLLVRLRNAGRIEVPTPRDYVYDVALGLEGVDDPARELEPFLVLERLDGAPLSAVLEAEFPRGMAPGDAVGLIRPLVRVLADLHQPWRHPSGQTWHVVYVDFKPANILIGPDGRGSLIDFGGCQVVVDGAVVLHGASTRGYAAPECEAASRVLLPCADVYSIGATLLHMLTGIDPQERWHRSGGRERPDPSALPPSTPPPLRDLIARCLEIRPSDRPADAVRVLEALAMLDPSS